VDRAKLLEVVSIEFHKHNFDSFAESMPNSNRPVIVPGCPICRVRAQTVSQFVDHLCEKVQAAVEREFSDPSKTAIRSYPFPVALHKIPTVRPS
jgi:hypothetical protein